MNTPNELFTSIEEDPIGIELGTDFSRFTTPFQMTGLCRITDDRIDVLAIISLNPNSGNFRKFLNLAKKHFNTVGFWEIVEPKLNDTLTRHGFKPSQRFERDELITGYVWKNPNKETS